VVEMAGVNGSTFFDTQLKNASVTWNNACRYDTIAMGKANSRCLDTISDMFARAYNHILWITCSYFSIYCKYDVFRQAPTIQEAMFSHNTRVSIPC
jgi:hypothetical protein